MTDAGAPAGEERKVVTVLFADLVDSTMQAERLDPEDVRGILSPYFARLRAELERYGGTVEKFIGDAVMALFGAPVAHEDDPERAVRAALAIRDAVAELNESDPALDLHVRIAVNTGEAVVSLGARPSEGEGMVAGDVVNTCSRLQEVAPTDGILVGETTYRATADAIEYRGVKPVRAKGKAEPIPVWEPVAPRFGAELSRARRAPLVGRWHELNLLLDALVRAREERAPQLVTLVGVPGIGKTRLVRELLAAVEGEPELVSFRLGRSLPYGEGVTFSAVADMAKAEAAILKTDRAEEAEEKLRRAVRAALSDPDEARWVEGHLRPLMGLGDGEGPRGDRREESFAAWRRFFEALAERRLLVLVFEDLHWADEGLLDFIDHLVEWASGVPLLVLCTSRPELLERRSGWGGGKPNVATVSLSPLSDEETAHLVSALLRQAVLPPEIQSAVLSRAGGNPLYAEEYVQMLVDRGFLRRDGDGWRLEAREELPLPESVQGIIAARIDTLPAEEKALLQDAAVVGKAVWVGAVAAIGERERSAADDALHALARKEFLRRERRSSVAGETEYAFRHVLVRDVAYGQIPRARRAEKHRVAAESLEGVGRLEDHAEMIAHQYLSALAYARAAGQGTESFAGRARIALRHAGDRASALYAFGRAWRFYEAALELWPPEDPARAHLLFRYGKAQFHAERAGASALAEARDALLAAGEKETAAEAQVMLGELLWFRGERDRAFEHFEAAAELLEDSPASRSKAYVLSSLSRFRMAADEAEEAIRVGRRALAMAEELDLDELRAHALNNIGVARKTIGDWGGVADLERSLAIALEINSPESVRAYLNLGSHSAILGDLRRAFDLYAQGRAAAERLGDAQGRRWFSVERVFEDYWSGRWEEASRLADELLVEVEAGSELGCRFVRGWIRLARDNLAEALEDAGKALDFAREVKHPQALLPALALQARGLLAAGQTQQVAELAGELLETWAESGVALASFWTADLAGVMTALGHGAELLDTAARIETPTRWLEAAKAFAGEDFQRAAETYAEIGTLPDEAFARLRAGESLIAAGRREEADSELARALAFYRHVGADAYVREGEALLAASA